MYYIVLEDLYSFILYYNIHFSSFIAPVQDSAASRYANEKGMYFSLTKLTSVSIVNHWKQYNKAH